MGTPGIVLGPWWVPMAGAPRGPGSRHHQGVTSFEKFLTGKFRGAVFCMVPMVLAITHRTFHNNLIFTKLQHLVE